MLFSLWLYELWMLLHIVNMNQLVSQSDLLDLMSVETNPNMLKQILFLIYFLNVIQRNNMIRDISIKGLYRENYNW